MILNLVNQSTFKSLKRLTRISIFKRISARRKLSLTLKCPNMNNIKTFVFFDSETTGLPSQENNRTRITELCFIAVQSDHIKLGVFPRIQNKINFCFNPGKFIHPGASEITGLYNELLEYQSNFNETVFAVIENYLSLLRPPVCLVAHNGNRFDFPILRAEIHKIGKALPEDILCVDSLLTFRDLHQQEIQAQVVESSKAAVDKPRNNVPIEFQDGFDELLCSVLDEVDFKQGQEGASPAKKPTVEEIQRINETTPKKSKNNIMNGNRLVACMSGTGSGKETNGVHKTTTNKSAPRHLNFGNPSFKLQEVYKRLTCKEVIDAHKAECDVNMLIECAATLGDMFVDWSDQNARRLCDIPMMQPGRTIGT